MIDNETVEKNIKRYLDMLAEDFQGRIGFIIDEVKAVEERLNNKIGSEVKRLREDLIFRINEVEIGLDKKIDAGIKALKVERKESIGIVDRRIDTLEKKIDAMNKRIDLLNINKKGDSLEKGLSQEIKGLRNELLAHRNNTEMHVQRIGKKKTKESA
ncbi:MAG: hypothetical protein ACK4Z9_00980 [Thermodesulfovibrionales bacterium]